MTKIEEEEEATPEEGWEETGKWVGGARPSSLPPCPRSPVKKAGSSGINTRPQADKATALPPATLWPGNLQKGKAEI